MEFGRLLVSCNLFSGNGIFAKTLAHVGAANVVEIFLLRGKEAVGVGEGGRGKSALPRKSENARGTAANCTEHNLKMLDSLLEIWKIGEGIKVPTHSESIEIKTIILN